MTRRAPLSAYFAQLAEACAGLEATDREGRALPLDSAATQAVEMLVGTKANGASVILIGNGGSAAIASHAYADLSNGHGLRAVLFSDASLLTALANDLGQVAIYERPVLLWAAPGAVLVAISSSGQSENILRAVEAARAVGCRIITFSGRHSDNPLRQRGCLNFYVPSLSYSQVESAHAALAGYLTDAAR